jgi:hypothetical protein
MGVVFPFKQKSNMILRIVTEESKCFSTKQRVPYKIIIETIDRQELLER